MGCAGNIYIVPGPEVYGDRVVINPAACGSKSGAARDTVFSEPIGLL